MDGPKGFDPIVKSQGTITFFFLLFFLCWSNMIMDSHEFYRKRNCIFRHALSKSARMLKKKTCTGALRREKNLVKTLHEKQMAALLLYSSQLVQKSAKNKKDLRAHGWENALW